MSLFPTIIASLVVSLSLTNVTYTSLLMLVRIFGEPVPHSGLHIRPALSSRPFLYIFGECDTMRSLPIHPSPPRRLAGILSRRAFSFADIMYFATNCVFHFISFHFDLRSIRTFVVPRRRCHCFFLYLPSVHPHRSPSLITLLNRRIQTKLPSLLRLTAVNFPCHLFPRSLILSLSLSDLPFPFPNIPRLLTRHESLNTSTKLPTRRYNPKVQSFIHFFGQSA